MASFGASKKDTEVRLPRATKVKNKQPADKQITAEQLLREAKEIQLEDGFKAPKTIINDPEELAEYRLKKRKEFEDLARRVGRFNLTVWVKVRTQHAQHVLPGSAMHTAWLRVQLQEQLSQNCGTTAAWRDLMFAAKACIRGRGCANPIAMNRSGRSTMLLPLQKSSLLRRSNHTAALTPCTACWLPSAWQYATWEEQQKDFRRARSVWERALGINYRNVTFWLKASGWHKGSCSPGTGQRV